MSKKYLLSFVFILMLSFASFTGAVTNCDDQAKPALSCPTGYSIMCLSAGGYHWGCGKESRGIIIEADLDNPISVEGIKIENVNQIQPKDTSVMQGSDTGVGVTTVEEKTEQKIQERIFTETNNKETLIKKVTVRGWDSEKKEEVVKKVATALENNPNINSVDIAEEEIKINYSAPARLFGFWPINMKINVSSDALGKTKVKFPWYKFMARTDFSNIAEEINGVFQNNQSNLEFLKLQDTVQRQTQLFQTLSNILKTKHDLSKGIIQNIR